MRTLILFLALLISVPALAHDHSSPAAKVTDGGSRPDPNAKSKIKGDFMLTDQTGRKVNNHTYHGFYQLVYFGFTHCEDICPTDLQTAVSAVKGLGKDAKKFKILFITLDPERDRPSVIGEYLKMFGGDITGLSGTVDEIAKVAKEYRMFYEKVKTEDGADYEIQHTSVFYLLGQDGLYKTMFSGDVSDEELTKKLKAAIKE